MKGEFFCWLSHDDTFKRDKIERQVEAYKLFSRPNIILYSDYELIDEEGTVTGRARMAPVLGDRPQIALFRGAVNGCSVFIPRSAFDIAGLFGQISALHTRLRSLAKDELQV